MKRFGSIYSITNLKSGKKYIGQTSFTVEKRWKQHKQIVSNPKKRKSAIHAAILKYGIENFRFDELYTAFDSNELDRTEDLLIKSAQALRPAGYNLKTGGRNWQFTDEVKAKISKANKGRPAHNKGKLGLKGRDNHFYGKAHTKETKHLLSKQHSLSVIRSDGRVYSSGLEAAVDLGVRPSSVNAVLKKRLKSCQGYSFNYLSEGKPEAPALDRKPRTEIVWGNKTYKSISEASKDLGIAKTTFFRMYNKLKEGDNTWHKQKR